MEVNVEMERQEEEVRNKEDKEVEKVNGR